MNNLKKTSLLTWLLAAVFLAGCQQEGLYTLNLILEGQHRVEKGQKLLGAVLLVEGTLLVEEGAQVDGPVFMLGGRMEVSGEILSDVSLLGGSLLLDETARIEGDLNLGGGELTRSSGALVVGAVNSGIAVAQRQPLFQETFREQLPSIVGQAVALGLLAYLLARYLPRPLGRISRAVSRHALVSLAMGLLVGIVALALLVLMAFTFILIPISLLLGLVLAAAGAVGLVGIGSALGMWLADRLRWNIKSHWAAALGTLLFILVFNLAALLPVLRGFLPLGLSTVGLGAVFLTRFGLSEFVPAAEALPGEF